MPVSIQLSINEPCHENWNNMQPVEKGRFCNSCAKKVVDFTQMTDSQVLNYFLERKQESICGRLTTEQLGKPVSTPAPIITKRFWQWKYAAMLLLFFTKMGSKARAQVVEKISVPKLSDITTQELDTVPILPISQKETKMILGGISSGVTVKTIPVKSQSKVNLTITGRIVDNEENPIAGASVMIKGGKTGIATTAEGKFSLKQVRPGDVLQVSAIGYSTKEIKITGEKDYEIQLKLEEHFTGAVIVARVNDSDEYSAPPPPPKHIALIEVKDNTTNQPIPKATLIIERESSGKTDSVLTDKKGSYKLKKIEQHLSYKVKVIAEGYLTKDAVIKGWEFRRKKETKNFFLKKAEIKKASPDECPVTSLILSP